MKRSVGIGMVAILVLALIGTVATAKLYSVFNPDDSSNVAIERVSLDQLKSWITRPSFARWTNMEALEDYLAEKGIKMSDFIRDAERLSDVEKLSMGGRNTILKKYTPVNVEGNAIQNIECDSDDQELTFEMTNIGSTNWFLVDQTLTTGVNMEGGSKVLSGVLTQATPVQFYVNNFPANSLMPKYWMGEKLFYGEGKTFADACKADFLRTGKTVKCKLEPIPTRGGALANNYLLITPTFNERGTFSCD